MHENPLADYTFCHREKYLLDNSLFDALARTSIFGYFVERWAEDDLRQATVCALENFSESGEIFFRELEENYISKILHKKNYVFSLGGGVMNNLNLRNIIKRNSYNIYLEVEINILSKRLQSSKNRPLINNKNINEKLKELIKKRKNFYKEADLTIKNEKKISDTINALKKNFQIYD